MIKLLLPLLVCLLMQPAWADESGATAVVELYTSEGCSSCPPADLLLGELSERRWESGEVIALGFHVDYWDRLGWKDRFSDGIHSLRQRRYALAFAENSVYTPQMIVDGQAGFVGSDRRKAIEAIESAHERADQVRASISVDTVSAKIVRLGYSIDGTVDGMAVNMVLAQRSASTEVKRGENGGRLLTHRHVVRAFNRLPAATTGSAELVIPADVTASELDAILFVQDPSTLAILGAVRISL
jgi:hypothetical protein